MNDELKNYRAPRSLWPWVLIAAWAVAVLCVVGPMDYAENLAIEADLKALRALVATAKEVY